MAEKIKPTEDQDPADSIEPTEEDSASYTKEREEAAQRHLEESQEQARQQFVFLGEPEPEIDIPDPKDRPLDMESFSEAEKAALETQNEIASEDYKPQTYHDFVEGTFESPDVNPEAKEFQLKKGEPADEFVGPEAAAEASATGVNPRSAATASDREGMLQESDQLTPVSENAEPVSKSSPADAPSTIDKVLDDE